MHAVLRIHRRFGLFVLCGFLPACLSCALAQPPASAARLGAPRPDDGWDAIRTRWPPRAQEWRTAAPENLVLLDVPGGSAIVLLLPEQAPAHVENLRRLVRAGYYDAMPIVRVHDNYVVQWNALEPRPVPDSAAAFLPAEFTRPFPAHSTPVLPSHMPGDGYAPALGFLHGIPVGVDMQRRQFWGLHCYGALGAGRDDDSGSGGGRELYVVIGHAPRHLDRNVTLLGMVVRGMPVLSRLQRGPEPSGYFEHPPQAAQIVRARLADMLPPEERPSLHWLDWGVYVQRLHRMPAARAALAGLLAHPDPCSLPIHARTTLDAAAPDQSANGRSIEGLGEVNQRGPLAVTVK